MAELRPHVDALRTQGTVAVVGSGFPAMAKAFSERMGLPKDLPVLSDPKREAYQLAGFTRSIGSTFSLRALFNHLRARRKGFRQGRLAGDPWQQGGTLIVAPSGEVLFEYRSKGPGDHAAPERLVAALRGA
ncbi:MAG: hypothetical protein E6J85_03645 [Deltaproteobacteria bacterium]|nr:MAG: hypothetical protein E6J85_03645 [Deltaproteobacteria bacterium]TMB36830.1 MAG: hypothetical protein E6J61_00200 [Deltaproteobacteria bacterium]